MKTRFSRWAVAILAIAPFAVAAPAAKADTITLGSPSGGNSFSVQYTGAPYNINGSVGGGPFTWTVNNPPPNINAAVGSTVTTWCVDLFQGLANPTTYTITNVTSLANSTSILNLFAEAYKNGGTPDAKSFQLALWELRYDTSPSSLANGNFKYTGGSSTLMTAANSLVSQALYDTANNIDAFGTYLNGYSLLLLTSSSKQDQLLLVPPSPKPNNPVPAPPAALLAVIGAFAMGGRAAWFRKKSAA